MDAASAALFGALADEIGSSAWLVLVTRRDEPGGLALADDAHPRIELSPLSPEDVQSDRASHPGSRTVAPSRRGAGGRALGWQPRVPARPAGGSRGRGSRGATGERRRGDHGPNRRAGSARRRGGPPCRRARPDLPSPTAGRRHGPGHAAAGRGVLGPTLRRLRARTRWPRTLQASRDSRRRPTRACRSSCGGSCIWRLGCGSSTTRATSSTPIRRCSRTTSRSPAITRAHTVTRWSRPSAPPSAFRTPTRRGCTVRAIEAGRAERDRSRPATLAEAWEQLGEALRAVGEPRGDEGADGSSATAARRPDRTGRLCNRHAEVAKRSESLTVAVRWLKRGLRCVDPLQDAEAAAWRARMRSNLGGIRARQGRWSEAISACRQAIAEAESVGELRALAHACYVLDWALVESGRSDEATHSWRALEIYRQLGDPEHEHIVLNNLGGLAYLGWSLGRGDRSLPARRARPASGPGGRPMRPTRTATSERSSLTRDTSTRPRRSFSARDGCGPRRETNTWRSLIRRSLGSPYDAASSDEADADARGSDGGAAEDEGRPVRRPGAGLIAEAEAFGGDPFERLKSRVASCQTNDEQRPLLTRAAGIALARLGEKRSAIRELRHSLRTARDRRSEYDVAATIDVLHIAGGCGSTARLAERDRDPCPAQDRSC